MGSVWMLYSRLKSFETILLCRMKWIEIETRNDVWSAFFCKNKIARILKSNNTQFYQLLYKLYALIWCKFVKKRKKGKKEGILAFLQGQIRKRNSWKEIPFFFRNFEVFDERNSWIPDFLFTHIYTISMLFMFNIVVL